MDADKLSAYQTLYTCLDTVALLIAPISPFFADRLYLDLHPEAESVHLERFPEADRSAIDKALERSMAMAQTVTSMVLALRRKVNLKVRQPLGSIMVAVADGERRRAVEAVAGLILNEVNVKEIKYVDPTSGVLVKRVKPDFKKLGPKYGKAMKQVAAAIASMTQEQIGEMERSGAVTLDVAGAPVAVELADVEVFSEDIPGWLVANEGTLTVALDVTLTPQLRQEGIAREIVNRVQNIRKGRGYDITDRIVMTVDAPADIQESTEAFAGYIATQVLAAAITCGEVMEDAPGAEVLDIDGTAVKVNIEKQ